MTPRPVCVLLLGRPKLEASVLEVAFRLPLFVRNLFAPVPTVMIVVTRVIVHRAARSAGDSSACNNSGYDQIAGHLNG